MEKMLRIAAIEDLSCFGKCSLTVMLPIVSAMGIECDPIPTAVMSTHSGGFENFTKCDLTDEILKIVNHWKSYKICPDMIFSGYLASEKQADVIGSVFDAFGDRPIHFVDPAMGDRGRLYSGLSPLIAKKMLALCKRADFITPNLTEAFLLLGEEFKPNLNKSELFSLTKRLRDKTGANVVLTGVTSLYENKQGVLALKKDSDDIFEFFTENIDAGPIHGSGDIFASVMAGEILKGADLDFAVKKAVEFTTLCILDTLSLGISHSYGLRFENSLKYLTK